jgi:hypothetical protein
MARTDTALSIPVIVIGLLPAPKTNPVAPLKAKFEESLNNPDVPAKVILPEVNPESVREVNTPDPGVPDPIEPGDAKVAPFKDEAFKFGTLVVEDMTKGAVPVATVEVIW